MVTFKICNLDNAPILSQNILKKAQETLGFIPNYLGMLATSPVALETYISLLNAFSKSNFTFEEQQIILYILNHQNICNYYMLTEFIGKKGNKISHDIINSIKQGEQLNNTRIQALYVFIKALIWKRGCICPQEVENFLAIGFNQENVLEIITAISLNTFIKYTHQITNFQQEDEDIHYVSSERTAAK